MLYLVEFADWNSQKTIGYGCSPSGNVFNMGATDDMQYHTGTTAASRTTYGSVQYRYIEGLFENVYDWGDGCYCNSNGLNIITKPANFSDSGNGVAVGVPSGIWPSAFTVATVAGMEWVIYPTATGGNKDTYSADKWYFNSDNPCLLVGGSAAHSQDAGLFFVSCAEAWNRNTSIGCRLQKLP